MPFTLIRGTFDPKAGRPDGDSVRFRPDDPSLVFRLRQRGRPPKINQNNGTVQLRFEGIDTMESRANPPISGAATTSNLELLGTPNGDEEAPGYILSNQLGPHGRPIAFVFTGDPPSGENDGDSIFLDADRVKQSVNFLQVERGHAYPLFYDTLYSDLRSTFYDGVVEARSHGLGVWADDASQVGAEWNGEASLATMPPLWPKLWRRLDTYERDPDIVDPQRLDEFEDYLRFQRPERVFILSQGRSTDLVNVVTVNGNRAGLDRQPEDIVVMS
ncbi:MAG: hypothetical protein AAF430_09515 [Myxococcota bacterium]